jgi:hypothetical protein|tara:strand:- start:2295 stop:2876 length:582 start_codon:yes stop_codon:yes gene_type:complete
MNIALPILLLVFGGLSFWILTESTVKWYIKTVCVTVFCIFTIVFWTSMHTFLGWAASPEEIPEKVAVHWAVIKEPNKLSGYEGRIFLLLESSQEKPAKYPFLSLFGYKKESLEPRLYGLPYSRSLHEEIEKNIMPKLKNGQRPKGKFLNKGDKPSQKGVKGKGDSQKGHGGESPNADWQFHELLPSQIQGKPD